MRSYQFSVVMSCGGCSGAVDRSLKKLEGVEHFDISLENQTVEVTTNDSLEYKDVLGQITKTGKKVTKGTEKVNGDWKTMEV